MVAVCTKAAQSVAVPYICVAGLILELASPISPSLFLLLACLGSVARAITGTLHHPHLPHCSTQHVLGPYAAFKTPALFGVT